MKFYPASTQALLDRATKVSGFGFDISYDASLPVASSVKMAGKEGREHHEIILRQPGLDENNYLIAWQAAFVLHQYQMPETERANLSPNRPVLAQVKGELLEMYPSIPLSQRDAFAEHVIGGVLSQLRSVPVGLLVDIELHRNYEELHAAQRESLIRQVVEHIGCLQMTKAMFPEKLLRANQVMNATQALLVATLFEMPDIFAPYQSVGMEAAATLLLDICLNQVFDETHDQQLIDFWARNLDLEDWYRWA